MPPRVAAVQPYVKEYWEYMINGTGDQYYLYPENDTIVNVFDYKQCVEVRMQTDGYAILLYFLSSHSIGYSSSVSYVLLHIFLSYFVLSIPGLVTNMLMDRNSSPTLP